MNKETLIALKGSIKKWEDIVGGIGYDDGADNCPLCLVCDEIFIEDTKESIIPKGVLNKFAEDIGIEGRARGFIKTEFLTEFSHCAYCPVCWESNAMFCNATPWEDWSMHCIDVHGSYQGKERVCQCKKCTKLAKEELAFLKSLLSKKERKET